jgi:hypothetical protein
VKHRGTPYTLAATGETILAKRGKRWDRAHGVWIITALDDDGEYVACGAGSHRKLVPLADVLAYAAELGMPAARAAVSYGVGV